MVRRTLFCSSSLSQEGHLLEGSYFPQVNFWDPGYKALNEPKSFLALADRVHRDHRRLAPDFWHLLEYFPNSVAAKYQLLHRYILWGWFGYGQRLSILSSFYPLMQMTC